MLNFACRSPSLYEATVARMKEVFDAVFEVLVSKEDCNGVLFAIRGGNESLVPTTLAGAEHFLLQRAEKDGSSPLLRSVMEEAAGFLRCAGFIVLGGWEASSSSSSQCCCGIASVQIFVRQPVGQRPLAWSLRVSYPDAGGGRVWTVDP